MKKITLTQGIRHAVQLAGFVLFPGLFISVLSALKEIVNAIVTGEFSLLALSMQLTIVVSVFVITVLWGRFFCGYLCAFGSLQELLAVLTKRKLIKKVHISKRADKALKNVKYIILAFVVMHGWILGESIKTNHNPWSVFGLMTSGNIDLMLMGMQSFGFVLLVAIMLGAIFVERFFCRYLCPLGALFTLVSSKCLYKIKRDSASCAGCGLCARTCAMGIAVDEGARVESGECIDCMQCVGACHTESLLANPTPAVSGATFSSNGILEATANALGVSFDNPNDTLERGRHDGGQGGSGMQGGPGM